MDFADRKDAGRRLAACPGHRRGAAAGALGLRRGASRPPGRPIGSPGSAMRRSSPARSAATLQASTAPAATTPTVSTADPPARSEEVQPVAAAVRLAGSLAIPKGSGGIVVFAHGSGSSRHSPRNRHVAGVLNDAGLSTLLFDLLTPEEERDRANVFDIGLLAGRLAEVTGWLRAQPAAGRAAIGYFGASTGAAAALWAAAEPGAGIAAVVSRGGRPDLARPRLAAVTAPTLLIVGARDEVVLDLNRRAQAELRCQNHLAVVPGSSNRWLAPGTLDTAAGLARDWFIRHLAP